MHDLVAMGLVVTVAVGSIVLFLWAVYRDRAGENRRAVANTVIAGVVLLTAIVTVGVLLTMD